MRNERIFEAINYATVAHKDQVRKHTGIPMIVHPFGVSEILRREGYGDDIVIAGLLHDVVEDCKGYNFEDIKNKFGNNVAQYVKDVSEMDKSLPWKERKLIHIEHIKEASIESKIICAADKIHNLTSLYEDIKVHGDGLLDQFNAPRDEVKWYYRTMYKSIINGVEDRKIKIFDELKEILKLTVGLNYE